MSNAVSATATRCFKDSTVDVPTERQFVGFDAYKQAIDSGADLVILATPPGFRPMHFEAAVKAGKHIFTEKPVAVDAPGVRRFLAANEEAKKKNLMVAIGLQRRHDPRYVETIKRLHDGAIGDILATRVYWNGGGLWVQPAQARADRDGVPDAQLVLLQLAVRRSHRRAAHPQHRRQQLARGHDTRSKPTAWAAARSAPARSSARSSTTTPSSSPTPTARRCSASAATSTARGARSASTPTARRARPIWTTVAGRSSTDRTAGGGAMPAAVNNHHQEHHDMFAALRRGEIYNEGDYGAESTMTAILGRMATYSGKTVQVGRGAQLRRRPVAGRVRLRRHAAGRARFRRLLPGARAGQDQRR